MSLVQKAVVTEVVCRNPDSVRPEGCRVFGRVAIIKRRDGSFHFAEGVCGSRCRRRVIARQALMGVRGWIVPVRFGDGGGKRVPDFRVEDAEGALFQVGDFGFGTGKGHWFSLMGTFLPFEIITYAI
jgi:hypothetical protein